MSEFDKIIGYASIKNELLQICDMIRSREAYEDLGARLPQGILLYGDPGLGKTLMAKCLIAESGLKSYLIRKDRGGDGFVSAVTETFAEAKKNAPCIVFLDDLDKFANEDERHADAEEYVAVQAGIDEVKDSGVLVLATANNAHKLPGSLIRSGRFDRKIKISCPDEEDAAAIIAYYFSTKRVSPAVNMKDVSGMISYSSCAELETIVNEAAVCAGCKRKDSIEIDDIVNAVLREEYGVSDDLTRAPEEDRRRIALHEAGHLVVCEALQPGSVGLASIRPTERSGKGGFVHHCRKLAKAGYDVLVSLAGKAAAELYYPGADTGCESDIDRALTYIRDVISGEGTHGLGMVDVSTREFPKTSENYKARNEAVTHAELERYMIRARAILLENKAFLEQVTEALLEKETLLYSDIRKLRNEETAV